MGQSDEVVLESPRGLVCERGRFPEPSGFCPAGSAGCWVEW